VRWRSIVGASALVLALSGSTVSSAFAQTPVTQTTVAGSPDDKSKDDPNAAEEQPKPEKPKGETPAVETPAQPSGAATPEPEEAKATEPNPKPAEPTPDKPKPIADDPSPPLHAAHDGPASAQAPGPGTATQAAPAQTASPSSLAAHSVAGTRARHVSISHAPRGQRTMTLPSGRGAPGAPPSGPARLGAGGPSDDAAPTIGHPADRATTHVARVGPDDAAAAAALGERRQTRTLPLDPGPRGYDPTLLLTITFIAGIAFLMGRETRRRPRLGARR
jgi:hypothetical protein